MPNATLKLDESMTDYLTYAAAIEGQTVRNYTAKLCREFRALHPSIKQSLEGFFSLHIWLTVNHYERCYRLPKSYTDSRKPRGATLDRCYRNMISNRKALGV